MSTFPAVIRFAFLRIKKEHPGWGADVAGPRVAERLDRLKKKCPARARLKDIGLSSRTDSIAAITRDILPRRDQKGQSLKSHMNVGKPISRWK